LPLVIISTLILTFLVHVTKEVDAAGNEGAVRIHLDVNVNYGYAFRVTSKNCSPDFGPAYWHQAQSLPYGDSIYGIDATEYTGSTSLTATFESEVGSDGTMQGKTEQILNTVNSYGLLPCANPVVPPFADPNASSSIKTPVAWWLPSFSKTRAIRMPATQAFLTNLPSSCSRR